ncbi:hypothetical protein BKA63DRAFT_486800 [Paraphoma chrysanthemicola]|nr:hypothetical protein BKA63DRAFT_486800 [Paraphoma chrysanthemicola]
MRRDMFVSIFVALALLVLPSLADHNLTSSYSSPHDAFDSEFTFPWTYPLTFRAGSLLNITWKSPRLKNATFYIFLDSETGRKPYVEVGGITAQWYQWEAQASAPGTTFVCFVDLDSASNSADSYIRSTGFFVEAAISSLSLRSSTMRTTMTRPSTELSGFPIVGSYRSHSSSASSAQTTPADRSSYNPPLVSSNDSTLSKGSIAGLTIALCGTATIIAVGLVFVWARRRQHRAAQRRAEKQPVTASDGPDTPSSDELTTPNPRTHNYTPVPQGAEASRVETVEGTECVEMSATRERPRAEDLDELIS